MVPSFPQTGPIAMRVNILAIILCLAAPSLARAADLPAPGSGKSFRDCDHCPEMVVVPAGTVLGGNPADFADEPDGGAQLRPKVVVKQPFALGKYEVTQAEWEWVMGGNPSFNKGPRLPVEQVTWKDIQDFIAKLNARTGKAYRLPSEAEWEFAARAGNSEPFPDGRAASGLAAHAWFADNSNRQTHPVGQLKANAFGLHDMLGNVWEWVEDCYGANLTSASPEYFTKVWPASCYRVIRGGSVEGMASATALVARSQLKQANHNTNLGFRLARSLP
jgi:formylglycine-generating enzyme required for sulfatase activity